MKIKRSSAGWRQLLDETDDLLVGDVTGDGLVASTFDAIELVNLPFVPALVLVILIDGGVDDDPAKPRLERAVGVVLINVVEHLHESIIQDFSGLVPGFRVPQGDAHTVGVEHLVELFLTLLLMLATPFDDGRLQGFLGIGEWKF